MSPVFGHGRLRLYLLKLLEESPRHGYEVIRLLQDRFLGVYSPSPGTIYPRLARLEEEGLVTHEVVEGKKVFSLTDKGRAELNERLDELAELEQEISESVRDIAREVKEDVRDTVRSLREELTQMARDVRRAGGESGETWREQKADWKRMQREQKDEWRRAQREYRLRWQQLAREQREEWRRHAQQIRQEGERWGGEWRRIWNDAWSTFSGAPWDVNDDAEEAGRRAELDAELGEALADFVAEVRREVSDAALTPAMVAECRTVLDEAAARIRDALR
ncbi:DNA-binding PadR family transcriptional regulator [Thermocatellispora tengchongensis]|uniref:DNA-binding PadR family transcriptional regulator n=1 Tax=Thermocatellispora tengchongensis TaxID=1073253 RepID=A0A840P2H1_9ACTN|nr:PadR family transcriptional regulator [Thermocatellispora tengchongensis]MBB5132696.1 DNA-binding PadR family transcriptional regulator [Thermocatellispora tengchongensis]